MRDVRPLLPAVLLVTFAGWLGTFSRAADGSWAILGHGVLLAVLATAGGEIARRPRWLVASTLLVVAVLVAWWTSPVARAGSTAVTLLPALLAIPPAVAGCWRTEAERRRGVAALVVVVGLVAGWALLAEIAYRTPGASEPLGHHNLLAAWLVALLPLTALPIRRGGSSWALGVVAGLLGVLALVATESLGGLLGLGVVIVVAAWRRLLAGRHGTFRLLALAFGAVVVVGAVQQRRLQAILDGIDVSSQARWSYWRAGWTGWLERPWIGWGPGASRWTLAEWLRPIPGVHPPDQVVADLHGLAVQLLFELGLVGVVAVVVAMVVLAARRPRPADRELARASFLGLVGVAVIAIVSGLDLTATAVPVAILVVVGARQAADEPPARRGPSARRVAVVVSLGLALALGVPQLPRDRAHLAYDRAIDTDDPKAALARAVALDPTFPAYRWRLALFTGDAAEARRAAEAARALAPLWISAGTTSGVSATPLDEAALVRACELSPLGALPAFRLAIEGEEALAGERATRALAASPVLLAAVDWARRDGVLDAGAGRVERWRLGPDEVWRRAFTDAAEGVELQPLGERRASIGLVVDGEPATSLSLHAFRRRPWRSVIDAVEVDLDRVTIVRDVLGDGAAVGPGLPPWLRDSPCRLGPPPWATPEPRSAPRQ